MPIYTGIKPSLKCTIKALHYFKLPRKSKVGKMKSTLILISVAVLVLFQLCRTVESQGKITCDMVQCGKDLVCKEQDDGQLKCVDKPPEKPNCTVQALCAQGVGCVGGCIPVQCPPPP